MTKPPDYVVNEPVATGWVRTELYGDRDRASALGNAARAQLGWMRTIYGVNQRMAEGEAGGFYAHTQVLDDGSVIQTITNNGFDIIRIEAPPPVGKPTRRRYSDLQVSNFAVCGTCFNSEGIRQAVLWTSESAFTNIGMEVPHDGSTPPAIKFTPVEMMDNGFRAEASDVSHDGAVVVGSCDMWDGSIRAFRWTPPVDDPLAPDYPGGMKDLGALITRDFVQNYATSVSADGSLVVGYGYDLGAAWRGWVWTEAHGLTRLPDTGLGVANRELLISPNGRYIAGVLSVPLEQDQNEKAALWEITAIDPDAGPLIAEPVLIDQPDSFSEWWINPGVQGTRRDTCRPSDVSDEGLVIGTTTHSVLVALSGSDLDLDTGVATSFTTYQADPDTKDTVFLFDGATSEFKLIGDGASTGYADELGTLVGNRVRGQIVTVVTVFEPHDETFLGGIVTTHTISNLVSSAWTLTPITDEFGNIIGYQHDSLGDNTMALDVTSDAVGICGLTVDADANETPVIWLEGLGRIDLPLDDGWGGGRATAIGFAGLVQAESADA